MTSDKQNYTAWNNESDFLSDTNKDFAQRRGKNNSLISLLDNRGLEIIKKISHLTPQICSRDNSQIILRKVRDKAMTQVK